MIACEDDLAPSAFLRNQSDPQSESNQSRNIVNVQAVHQLHAMVFHGLGADLEDFGGLLGVPAFGDELEDFALPVRQLFERAFLVGDPIHRKLFQGSFGDFRTHIKLVVNRASQDRFDLLGSRLGLFRPRLGYFCPGFSLLRPHLRLLNPRLGLLRPRLSPLRPRLSPFNPRVVAGHVRVLILL